MRRRNIRFISDKTRKIPAPASPFRPTRYLAAKSYHMKISAQLNGLTLKVFIEDITWKKILLPFNKEQIKVQRLVYVIRNIHIFHDAISRSKPDAHDTLMFCRKKLTVMALKQQIKRAGYGEPYEVRLAWPNKLCILDRIFPALTR